MQVSFKQSPQAARATTKSSDVTRMMYASRAVPMAARNAVVGLIEVADGRSRSALFSGLYRRLERVLSVVVSEYPHEFHPKLKTRNFQFDRYMKLIFSESR